MKTKILSRLFVKSISLAFLTIAMFLCTTTVFGQQSCVAIDDVTVVLVSETTNPCTKTVKIQVDYTRHTAGQKSITISYKIAPSESFTSLGCRNVTGDQNSTGVAVSDEFTYNCSDAITIQVERWTNGQCGGGYCGNTLLYDGSGNSLPVIFGTITAERSSNDLKVQWQTLQETNVKEYEIQASKDGTSWSTIGKQESKAHNGNSDKTVNYEWDRDIAGIAFAGFFLAFLLLPVFQSRKVKLFLLAIMISVGWVACTKSSSMESHSGNEPVWVRIVQQAFDGSSSTSKTVKVIQK